MNKVELKGRLVKDVEFRATETYKLCRFCIAVEREYTNKQGKKETDFLDCVCWGDLANWFNTETTKGDLIYVCGAIQTRSYETQDGQKKKVVEINVYNANTVRKAGQPHISSMQGAGEIANNIINNNKPIENVDEYDPFNDEFSD